MATGEPVVGLELRAGEGTVTTDSEGLVAVHPGPFVPLTAVRDETWRLASHGIPDRNSGERTLWVYGMMEVRGRLSAESALTRLDSATTRLVAVSGQPVNDEPDGLAFGNAIMIGSGLDRLDFSGGLDMDGSFRIVVPRVPGYRLSASAPGWQPDSIDLTTERVQFVRLELTKASFVIRGTLRDTTGAPLAGALVSVYVIVEIPLTELDRGAVRAVGHAYTLTTGRAKNRAVIKYHVSTGTAADGTFEAAVNTKGRLIIVAKPRGDFHTTLVERPSLDADVDGLDIAACAGDGRTVRVVRSGGSFRGDLVLVDVTGAEQHTVVLRLGETGEFFMARLIPGHQYSVHIRDEPMFHGFFIWEKKPIIDLAALAKKPDIDKFAPEHR